MVNSRVAHEGEDANIAGLLAETASWRGGHPAVVEPGDAIDYAHLQGWAMAIAAALLEAGVGPGEPVGIMLERGAAAAAAMFGVVGAGATAVLIQETLRARQIEHILEHSGARYFLTEPERLAALPRPINLHPALIDVRALRAGGEGVVPRPRGADDLAQIIYTSGSTGAPKGVAVTHGNLRAAAGAVSGYLHLRPKDRIASLLPFNFVYGMSQLLCAVRTGATLVVERSSLPRDIVRRLEHEQVSVVAAVPSLWRRLLQSGGFATAALPALRVLTNAGGQLPVETVRTLRRSHPAARLYLMYGLTEVLRSTYLPPEEVDAHPDSIGLALPGSEVFLVDDEGHVIEGDGEGELVHRGPTVTLGYWRDPMLTARVFRPDPRPGAGTDRVVFTGDLVRRDADGFLYYISRKDRLIKTMGCRVGPDEVLEVLYASGEVAEAEVVGEPDELWGARIAAYVVPVPGGSLRRLAEYCTSELPRYMRPARFELREALPLLPSGKHDLGALREAVAR
jgi:acyl-CoA synthetase (AMP-forming)/AMP-acid ligase II